MKDQRQDNRLRRYLLWAFGLAWPIQCLATWFFLRGERQVYQLVLMLSMFAPLAAALLARVPVRDMGWKPRFRQNWKWLLAAWFCPALLCSLGAALYFAVFPGSFAGFKGTEAALGEAGLRQLAAQGLTVPVYFAVTLGSAVSAAPVVNVLPSLGEELGWRGVMYPLLKERFGTARGRVLGGAIWGAWHWPIMLLAGYEYGFGYWGAPVSGMLLFCLICVGLGTLFDFVYERSRCIWLPALAHGAFNAFAAIPVLLTAPDWSGSPLLGPLPVGILAALPFLLLAAFLLLRGGEDGVFQNITSP